MVRFIYSLAVLLCFFQNSILFAVDDPQRFVAKLEHGERIQDKQLRNWYSDNALPQLAGKPLLTGGNPMRWLVDRNLQPPAVPKAYVEMHNGDRLPGEVLSAVSANSTTMLAEPSHFLVAPSSTLTKSSRTDEPADVRVIQNSVRKIVWKSEDFLLDQHHPLTLFYKDGRRIRFRSIRFTSSAISLLLESGRRTASFDEVAEIHLQQRDPWQQYVQELAVLFPQGFYTAKGLPRLLQLVTDSGLVATTSMNRFTADSQGNNNDSDRWLHGIQPYWALDILWVPSRNTWMRRSWPVEQIPISRFAIEEDRSGAMFSAAAWHARTNQSVQGTLLRSAGEMYGWGLGVIAPSRITVPVSPFCIGVKTKVGIDFLARSGGCIRARIRRDSASGPVLYETPITIGSSTVHETGELRWKDANNIPEKLVFEVDPVLTNRPPGADPFDVRDMTNWLEPVLLLDREKLEAEIQQQVPATILALSGWQLISSENNSPVFSSTLREVDYERDSWRTTVLAKDHPIRLVKHIQLSDEDRWLILAHGKFGNYGQEPQIEVLVDGHLMLDTTVPVSSKHDLGQTPLYASLSGFAGKEIELEIRQHPSNAKAPIDWRGIQIGNQRTTLLTALEHPTAADVQLMKTLDGPEVQVSLYNEEDHLGRPAVETTSGGWVQIAKFEKPVLIRERPRLGEFRDLRFAFKKFGGGSIEVKLLHEEDHNHSAIYRIGQEAKPIDQESPVRLEKRNLDEKWLLMNRNLYSDFKSLNITGIAVRVPDGQKCIWDHFYFARSYSDLDLIAVPNPDRNNWDHWDKRTKEINGYLPKAMVQIDFGDGKQSIGAIVQKNEGIVIVPGHLAIFPGQDITVITQDGTRHPAKTLGLHRPQNIAFARITEKPPEGGWQAGEMMYRSGFDKDEVSMLLGSTKKEPTSWLHEVIRLEGKNEDGALWPSSPSIDFQLGTIAVDKDHKISGMLTHRLSAGQPVVANLGAVRAHYDRLKNGEVIGNWTIGSGPVLGLHAKTTAKGVEVTQVTNNSPASSTGIQQADILIRVLSSTINSLVDIDKAVRNLNPGDEIEIEFQRGKDRFKKRLKLAPRL
ncbi:MAG: PDZ domain-containing protein [Pirellulales bacterium]